MPQRSETLVETQGAVGESWSVTFTPRTRYRWKVVHIAVSIPGWISGGVRATVTVGGEFRLDTPQGHRDTADGPAIEVADSQPLTVTWEPIGTAPLVMTGDATPQGVATVLFDEEDSYQP